MDVLELFRSCRSGDIEKVRYLIEIKDVEVNARDNWDSTPLYYASLCGHEELVELLLKNGSRCEANTFDGERCLYGALTDRIREILRRYKVITAECKRRDSYNEFLRRAFEKGMFSDISFVIQGETIPAHRVVLAARSSYFAERFMGKWKNKTTLFPNVRQIDPVHFKGILKYLYTGRLHVPVDECDPYLYLAQKFKLHNVTNVLKKRLVTAELFGASKRGVVKVTMVTIDAETQGRNLRDDLAKVAEEAIPYPFKSEQLAEGSFGISSLWEQVDCNSTDFSSFSDVCFDVAGYQFFCNKFFFSDRSDYFKALFEFSSAATARDVSSGEGAGTEPFCRITIHDVTPDVFAVVVAYVYTNYAQISLDFEDILNVLCASEMYLLNGLKRLCSNALSRILDVHNVIDVVRISKTFNLPRLESDCCRYMADALDEIIDNPGLAELIQEDAKAIKNRQETDSIPLVDDIRHHLYNAILPSYSGDVSCFAEHRIELLESLLKKLDLEC